MPERNGIFYLLTRQFGTRLDELFQRVSEGSALCKRYFQGTGPQVRASLQNMLCKLRGRLLILRCGASNDLAEVLGLLPKHQGSNNCPVTRVRFINSGNIQRIPRQYRIHLVRLVTEHR